MLDIFREINNNIIIDDYNMYIASPNIASEREEIIQEGLAKLIVPRIELYKREDGSIEPAWMPVFYNPHAVVSRDLTVVFLKTAMNTRNFFYIDLLSGTGIRGIRIGLEVGGYGLLNDVDPRAYYYIKRNISLNKLEERLEAYNQEANTLLNMLVFSGIFVDYIDVDPYGSPVPFIDSVFKPLAKRAFIGISATDLAPLSCTHPHKTLVRYWDRCIKVDFSKEYALRLLLANIALRSAALGFSITPFLSMVHRHYVRVFLEVERSYSRAYKQISGCLGYIWYCPDTLERGYTKEAIDVPSCSSGKKPVVFGKIWICNTTIPEIAERALREVNTMNFLNPDTIKILVLLKNEAEINTLYVRLDKLCGVLKINMPKINTLITKLREKGFKATRTHMDIRGIKTTAPLEELKEILLKSS